ncbi:hypothetical protein [Ktedonobacter racemifer]|uniref:hypothetical protein n=1 Tax=Ktedonobacter racemifer TaxID=363277 RepID=UPI0012F8D560|nr:hypothetical protein [Ktedonobacter racemifer]
MPSPQLEAVFASLPDAALACDRDGKLPCMNGAALKLFEVSSTRPWLGTPYREFLQRYEWYNELHHPTFPAPWLLKPDSNAAEASHTYEQTLMLSLPSGRKTLLELRCSSLLDAELQMSGMVSLFHEVTPRYQKALHLQRVFEAISALNEAIALIPEHLAFAFSDDMPLLSSPMLFVAQQLVDVIRQVLAYWRVSLIAFGSQTQRFSYAVGSGFTAEQEQQLREIRGRFLFTEIVDVTVRALLHANQEVILRADRLHFPVGYPADFGAANLLIIPCSWISIWPGPCSLPNRGETVATARKRSSS